MRPRHKAAENVHPGRYPDGHRPAASMRPRHKAAENCSNGGAEMDKIIGFNEAAA